MCFCLNTFHQHGILVVIDDLHAEGLHDPEDLLLILLTAAVDLNV